MDVLLCLQTSGPENVDCQTTIGTAVCPKVSISQQFDHPREYYPIIVMAANSYVGQEHVEVGLKC